MTENQGEDGQGIDEYFGKKAGLVWAALKSNGPMGVSALKRKTKLKEGDLYCGLGWLARENKIRIIGTKPMLFKFVLNE